MKKLIFVLLILTLIMSGCTSGSGMIEYDYSALKSELKEEGIDPKLPSQFPFPISEFEKLQPPHESSRYEVRFTGEGGEIFTLVIHAGPVTYDGNMDKEDVTIDGSNGFYTESDIVGPSLHWTDGEYHYILDYQTTALAEMTKEQMLNTAESFE